jgi:Fe-S-cluster containining protein
METMASNSAERWAYQQRLDVFLSSRAAGDALTGDALAREVTRTTLVEAAANVAGYADEAIAVVVDEFRPALDCAEGCSHCCCKPGVLVSAAELVRIVGHVQAVFTDDDVAALRERIAAYANRLAGRDFNAPTDASIPCPLLVNHRCSVYEVRPLTCRGYNSTDADACRRAHYDQQVMVPLFALVKDVTDGATVGAAVRLRAVKCVAAMLDLGTALSLASDSLDADAIMQAMIDLPDGFAAAQHRSWVEELWHRVRITAAQCGVETG